MCVCVCVLGATSESHAILVPLSPPSFALAFYANEQAKPQAFNRQRSANSSSLVGHARQGVMYCEGDDTVPCRIELEWTGLKRTGARQGRVGDARVGGPRRRGDVRRTCRWLARFCVSFPLHVLALRDISSGSSSSNSSSKQQVAVASRVTTSGSASMEKMQSHSGECSE